MVRIRSLKSLSYSKVGLILVLIKVRPHRWSDFFCLNELLQRKNLVIYAYNYMDSAKRLGAYFFSALSHPLLILLYGLFLLIMANPYLFPHNSGKDMGLLLLIVFFSGVAIPGIAILLMMGVGMIQSIHLPDKKDRIGPLIVTSIAYLWLYLNIRTHNAIPMIYAEFVLGAIISLFIAFFINNFSKISLHGVGLGGLLMFFLKILGNNGVEYLNITLGTSHLSIHAIGFLAILISFIGISLSSRIYLKAHTNQDVFGGLIVGITGQLIAALIS